MAMPAEALEFKPTTPEADVYYAARAETDANTRRRLMMLLGSVAVEGAVSAEQEAAEQASLRAVTNDYFSGNPERVSNATARLTADLRANTFEILCESGHIREADSFYRADGFYQNGYGLRAMCAHGTMHTKHSNEHRRRAGETLNELRIEDGFKDGRFQTHYFVEESRAPDEEDMPIQTTKDSGYNTKTWKAMLRLTEVDAWGNRVTFSAPVFGVNKTGERHDLQGVRNIHSLLDLEMADMSAAGTLENAYWVKKERLPQRIISLVRAYDAGLGVQAFFGVEGKAGNYDTIVEESLRREQQAEQKLSSKVEQLAHSLRGADCEEALRIMAIHAKDFAAELCREDLTYDPAQFGGAAAWHIEMARHYTMLGDEITSRQQLELAKQTAIVYMCGMILEMEKQVDGTIADKRETNSDTDECEFISKECPVCHAKNVKTRVTKTHITGNCGCSVKRKIQPVLELAA